MAMSEAAIGILGGTLFALLLTGILGVVKYTAERRDTDEEDDRDVRV